MRTKWTAKTTIFMLFTRVVRNGIRRVPKRKRALEKAASGGRVFREMTQ